MTDRQTDRHRLRERERVTGGGGNERTGTKERARWGKSGESSGHKERAFWLKREREGEREREQRKERTLHFINSQYPEKTASPPQIRITSLPELVKGDCSFRIEPLPSNIGNKPAGSECTG